MFRRRHDNEDGAPVDCEMVLACDAYLDGRYIEYLAASQRPIPPWAWLNVIAHSSRERLEALASCPADAVEAAVRAHVEEWQLTLTVLARTALDKAVDEQRLRTLQSSVMVPLELELIGRANAARMSAADLTAYVLSALEGKSRPSRGCLEP
jgi:hypothetical protein